MFTVDVDMSLGASPVTEDTLRIFVMGRPEVKEAQSVGRGALGEGGKRPKKPSGRGPNAL